MQLLGERDRLDPARRRLADGIFASCLRPIFSLFGPLVRQSEKEHIHIEDRQCGCIHSSKASQACREKSFGTAKTGRFILALHSGADQRAAERVL